MATCRVCEASLEPFLEFGPMPLADGFVTSAEVTNEYFFDLSVGMCLGCAMVQLVDVPPANLVFRSDYPYRSSGSLQMTRHFEALAHLLLASELRGHDPFVVEIGSNDGVMLRTIAGAGVRHVGVEPSADVAAVAAGRGISVLVDFFSDTVAQQLRERHGPADVIYAANTLCHIADLGAALRGIETLLADDGVFIFEDPYLGDIVARNAFDQIYDEHVFYFTLSTARSMLTPFGLEVVDVEPLDVHGGELRYVAARTARRPISDAVHRLTAHERRRRLGHPATLREFAARVDGVRRRLQRQLEELRAAGKRVVGYGATAKSTTVTNACGIDTDLVEFVCDSTPAKQGLYTPGTHLPVLAPEAFSSPHPDVALLFAWNHADEIMAKERSFTAAGGSWLLYVPDVEFVPGHR